MRYYSVHCCGVGNLEGASDLQKTVLLFGFFIVTMPYILQTWEHDTLVYCLVDICFSRKPLVPEASHVGIKTFL